MTTKYNVTKVSLYVNGIRKERIDSLVVTDGIIETTEIYSCGGMCGGDCLGIDKQSYKLEDCLIVER